MARKTGGPTEPQRKRASVPARMLAVRMPEEMRRAVKVAAAERGTSVQALVIEALRHELNGGDK